VEEKGIKILRKVESLEKQRERESLGKYSAAFSKISHTKKEKPIL